MRPEIKIVNVQTGEEIVREMNDEEYAQYEIDVAKGKAKDVARAKAEADKAALLAKLGISADEDEDGQIANNVEYPKKEEEPVVHLLIPDKYESSKVYEYINLLANHFGTSVSQIKKQAMDNPTKFYFKFEEWIAKQQKEKT